jgi:hypothetical protein
MHLLIKSGILSLLAVSTISLSAIAETITETPNRPATNPFLDCEADVVSVDEGYNDEKNERHLLVRFGDDSLAHLIYGSDVLIIYSNEEWGVTESESILCPDEAKQQVETRRGLHDSETIEETVKSEAGQRYLQSEAGEYFYEHKHEWMQDQIDQWTSEWEAEGNGTEWSDVMEALDQLPDGSEPDIYDRNYHYEMGWAGLVKEYSTGVGNPGDSKLTPDEIRVLEELLGDGDSEDSAIAIPNL